ncbi:MAG: peptidoglycan-binding protein [Acidimicrobiia bacterium]
MALGLMVGLVASVALAAAPAAAAPSTPGALPTYGQSGDDVRRLQEALIARGFSLKGGIDGVFSERTRATLKAFQRVVGFKSTGVVDDRTAKLLGLLAPTTLDPAALPATGATGDAVWSLQQALINAGVPVKGGADGVFGLATTIAIGAFQQSRGLPVTKQVDAATASALGLVPGAAPAAAPRAAAPAPAAAPAAAPIAAPTAAASAVVAPAAAETPAMLEVSALPVRGAKGDAVRTVQQALVAAGVPVKGGVDGIFGAATAIALGTFQQARGLATTQAADLPTAIALGIVPSLASLGMPEIAVFPMQGRCSFTDTWQEARGSRRHEGVDIIGARGLAIYAVVDGTITKQYTNTSLSGNALRLTAADGTYFFYAHLDSFAPGIAPGVAVRAGQLLGYNGATGNTTTPHLHFEVHPGGGAAINPYPVVKAVDACHVTELRPQG